MSKNPDLKKWMDERGLNAAQVAKALGTEEQTVRKWRSQGIPDRRRPHVERYMSEWIDPTSQNIVAHSENNVLRIEFNDEEMDQVSTASNIVDTPVRDFIRRAAVHQARFKIAEELKQTTLQAAETNDEGTAPPVLGKVQYPAAAASRRIRPLDKTREA